MNEENVKILGIESSCDETSAAVTVGRKVLSNIIAGQEVHREYGGVVPELASRAHQQNIVPVVDMAIKKAGRNKHEINAIALTRGPGLMGSLLVGVSFAKALSLALRIPIIDVNHMQAHILAHFIQSSVVSGQSSVNTQYSIPNTQYPNFPFLCLTVSGGHTQIVRVNDYLDMEVLGQTHDDAAGEAFDKAAKIMGLPYPGGPLVDKYSALGNSKAFTFPVPQVPGLDFSFSGLKTAFSRQWSAVSSQSMPNTQYSVPNTQLIYDLCASFQHSVVSILMEKLHSAVRITGIKEVAIAGGVSANSGLRKALLSASEEFGWKVYIPKMEFCTDNAAMIAITGYFKYLKGDFANIDIVPLARYSL